MLLIDINNIGDACLGVFHRAGFKNVDDLISGGNHDQIIDKTANELVSSGQIIVYSWRNLAKRCKDIIRRFRFPEALPYCPDFFICPITQECMEDPYIDMTGTTYEKWAIEWYNQKYNKRNDIIPNIALKKAIEEYKNHFMVLAKNS